MDGVGPSTRSRTTKSTTAFKQPARIKPSSNKNANAPLQSTPDDQVLPDNSLKDVEIFARLQSIVEQSGDHDGLITETINALTRKNDVIDKLNSVLLQRTRFYKQHMEAVNKSKTDLDLKFAEVQNNCEALKKVNDNLEEQNKLFQAQILANSTESVAQDDELGNPKNEIEELVSQNYAQKCMIEQLEMKLKTSNRLLTMSQQELLKLMSSGQSSLSTGDAISKSKSKPKSDRYSSITQKPKDVGKNQPMEETEPGHFQLLGQTLKIAEPELFKGGKLAQDQRDELTEKELAVLDSTPVAKFYGTIRLFKAMNKKLLELYKVDFEKAEYSCAVCSYLDIPKFGSPNIDKAFQPFFDHSHFIRHYHKYHESVRICKVCNLEFDTAHQLDRHNKKMKAEPSRKHREYNDKTKNAEEETILIDDVELPELTQQA